MQCMTTPTEISDRIRVTPDGCWRWTGSITNTGYGQVYAHGAQHLVHRYTYSTLIGPIPEGMSLDHLCRVRACCNPDHLEPVTHAENMRRMWAHRRRRDMINRRSVGLKPYTRLIDTGDCL